MNVKEAKEVFASMMQLARKRQLTPREKSELTAARQTLRRAKRPAANPPRKSRGLPTEVYVVEQDGVFAIQYASGSLSWTPKVTQATRFATRSEAEELRDFVSTRGLPHARVTSVRVYTSRNPRKAGNKIGKRAREFAIKHRINLTRDSHGTYSVPGVTRTAQTDSGAINLMRLKLKSAPRTNPPKGAVKIYGRLLRIEAQKTQRHICDAACKKANHCYFHDFKSGACVYGMPDGTLVIR